MKKLAIVISVSLVAVFCLIYLVQKANSPSGSSSSKLADHEKTSRRYERQGDNASRVKRTEGLQRSADLIRSFEELGRRNLPTPLLSLERKRLIRQIAELEGYEAAMRLLNEHVGHGGVRRGLLEEIFAGLQESIPTSLERIGEIPEDERSILVRALIRRINSQGLSGSQLALLLENKDVREAGGLSAGLTVSFMNAQESDILPLFDRIRTAMEHLGPSEKSELLGITLQAAAKGYRSFEGWKFLSSFDNLDMNDPDVSKAKEELLTSMISQDSPKAIELIYHDKELPPSAFLNALSRLYGVDSKAAEDWIERNAGSFSAFEADQVKSAQIEQMLRLGNLDSAETNLNGIHDKNLRDQVESNIYKAQRKEVLEQVDKDPSSTIHGLISKTESPRDGLLVMEAMSSWINKDPDQAAKWYSDNWNTLQESQAQFIAGAYLKESLSQGDLTTAKQWLMHVKDVELRKFFEAEVQRVSGD